MIIHHLCHSRSHTASHAPFAFAIFNDGTQVVVRRILVPLSGQQWQDGSGAVAACTPARTCPCSLGNIVLLHPGYFVGIPLQPGTHVVGHVVGVDAARVAIAEHGDGAVVVRDDDEAAAIHVKHVETAHLAGGGELRRGG